MRSPTREQVLAEFLARVQALDGFESVSRRSTLDPLDLSRIDTPQPAIVLLEHDEETTHRGRGLPPILVYELFIIVYAEIPRDPQDPSSPDRTTPGATIINPLIEIVEAMFEPDSPLEGICSLGGLVSHAWIEGKTLRIVGDITPNGQCCAVIPVRLMFP